MSIQKPWVDFSLENIIQVPQVWGTYELANRHQHIVYMGRSEDLKTRLISHLNSNDDPCYQEPYYFRYDDDHPEECNQRSNVNKYLSQYQKAGPTVKDEGRN